jgi:hypothetical protein
MSGPFAEHKLNTPQAQRLMIHEFNALPKAAYALAPPLHNNLGTGRHIAARFYACQVGLAGCRIQLPQMGRRNLHNLSSYQLRLHQEV